MIKKTPVKSKYEDKPGSMVLFPNDKKTSDNHPDHRGKGVDLSGNPVWISAWEKTTADGRKYLSVSIQPRIDEEQKQVKKPLRHTGDDVAF